MSIDYDDIRKFVNEKHPEKKSTFITILKMKLDAAGIDDLKYFEGMHPKGIKWILDNSKDSYLFIEYLQSKSILHITEDKNQNIFERINEIVQQNPKFKKAANQLMFWLEVGTFKITDFKILTRGEIQQKCARDYNGPKTVDGIVSILRQLGITIKDEPTRKTGSEPEL